MAAERVVHGSPGGGWKRSSSPTLTGSVFGAAQLSGRSAAVTISPGSGSMLTPSAADHPGHPSPGRRLAVRRSVGSESLHVTSSAPSCSSRARTGADGHRHEQVHRQKTLARTSRRQEAVVGVDIVQEPPRGRLIRMNRRRRSWTACARPAPPPIGQKASAGQPRVDLPPDEARADLAASRRCSSTTSHTAPTASPFATPMTSRWQER